MSLGKASDLPYTASEIGARLAASTIAFDSKERLSAAHIAAIRQSGITQIELCMLHAPSCFDYRNRTQVSEIIRACDSLGVSITSAHGPGVPYNSDNEGTRREAVEEAIAAARVAEEMGAQVMVCHLRPDEPSERTVADMLEGLESSRLKLGAENGENLGAYAALVDRVGSDRFGMVVDVGHTRDPDGLNPLARKERARRTVAGCGKRLISLHLHDYLEPEWDHIAPMDGDLQWDEVFKAFRDIHYQGLFTFEAILEGPERGRYSPENILRKTAEFPEAFIQRYGSG